MSDSQRAEIEVTGRVYGVHYAGTVVSQANRLGLQGFVTEHPDERIELVVEGDREDIEELIDWCQHDGPPSARVDNVQVKWAEPEGTYVQFDWVR